MPVDADQGDASSCDLSEPCVCCEVRQVWMTFSVSLHLAAVDLAGNARQTLHEQRRRERLQILQEWKDSQATPAHACAKSSRKMWQ